MADIFINYSQSNRAAASRLSAWLHENSYTVWWDTRLVPGEHFARTIERELSLAKVILTVWSRDSVRSEWVRREAQFALDKGVHLIAIRLEDVPVPPPFNVYQALLVTDWNQAFSQLRNALDQALRKDDLRSADHKPDVANEWAQIKNEHNPADLERFLTSYPDSDYTEAARERLAVLGWERLRTSDDVQALETFAREYGKTTAADHARKRLLFLQSAGLRGRSRSNENTTRPHPTGFGQRAIRFILRSFTPRPPTPDVFISYRREDSADVSGRIFDRLVQEYSRGRIFKDVDSIPLGVDFREYITEILDKCSICLVVMGKDWLGSKPGSKIRRIDESRDFLRIEIEAALENGIPVIPLFVHGATMPEECDLPQSIGALAYRHGLEIRRDPNFHKDMDRLISGIDLYKETATPLDHLRREG